eukprot:UC4_evm8s1151
MVMAHPEYLDDIPNGHNDHFRTLPGVGALGHTGDKSGAPLNSFGRAFCSFGEPANGALGELGRSSRYKYVRSEVKEKNACTMADFERVKSNEDDDDDDDHHHHKGGRWTIKFCCDDADKDGQSNGHELGDPCLIAFSFTLGYDHGDTDDQKSFSCKYTSRCAATTCNCRTCDDSNCKPKIPNAISCDEGSSCNTENQYCPPNRKGSVLPDGLCCVAQKWSAGTCNISDESLGKVFVQGKNARKILASAGWEIVDDPFDADIIWVIHRCSLGAYTLNITRQAINLLPWDDPISDKGYLYSHIQKYDNLVDSNSILGKSTAFLPETYLLNEVNEREAAGAAIDACTILTSTGSCNEPWILKRTDLANGKAATLIEKINSSWIKGEVIKNLTKNSDRWLLQRYIDNPLLLDGRKSEIRCYWLVVSLKPLIVLYNPGT